MKSWSRVYKGNLPPLGTMVLLMDVTDQSEGVPRIDIGIRKMDFWTVQTDHYEYSLYEKWTHWTHIHLPTGRILKILKDEVLKERGQ